VTWKEDEGGVIMAWLLVCRLRWGYAGKENVRKICY
jgi:hypothetical protein